MDNAREGLTISDPNLPDNPLVYVNKGFLKMTGYQPKEVIGRNCRYLQGPDTDKAEVAKIKKAIKQQKGYQTEIINYRKNGDPFWNYLSISPIYNDENQLIYFIGVQDDITLKKESEQLKQLIAKQKLITQTALEAQEQERETLGKELHDNVNQLLATVKLYLNLATEEEALRFEMLNRSKSVVDKAIDEIRKLSRALVTPNFNDVSLQDYVTELANTVQLAAPFKITILYTNFSEQSLTDKRKLMLYRIIQEQLNNIIKYAGASKVVIKLQEVDHVLQLTITDDGIGFNPTKTAKGIGLKNMNSRLELENSSMHIISSPGKGCQLLVKVPLC